MGKSERVAGKDAKEKLARGGGGKKKEGIESM